MVYIGIAYSLMAWGYFSRMGIMGNKKCVFFVGIIWLVCIAMLRA